MLKTSDIRYQKTDFCLKSENYKYKVVISNGNKV